MFNRTQTRFLHVYRSVHVYGFLDGRLSFRRLLEDTNGDMVDRQKTENRKNEF